MSAKQNDGGPAFPCDFAELPGSEFSRGLSMRDWFASMALNEQEIELLRLQYEAAHPNLEPYSFQVLRYFHADAMIQARKLHA